MYNYFSKKEQTELHIIVFGRVQGVGFRAAARYHALQLNLKGFARNLDDGSVEMIAQGDREMIDELIKVLKKEFQITNVESQQRRLIQICDSFQII